MQETVNITGYQSSCDSVQTKITISSNQQKDNKGKQSSTAYSHGDKILRDATASARRSAHHQRCCAAHAGSSWDVQDRAGEKSL